MSFEKKVLKEGLGGFQQPNKLSTVLVDVVGSWTALKGEDVIFQQKKNATLQLGKF